MPKITSSLASVACTIILRSLYDNIYVKTNTNKYDNSYLLV